MSGQEEARLLLINNNNTRTKFTLASEDKLLSHLSIATSDVTVDSVKALLKDWHYEDVILASVVPDAIAPLREAQDGKTILEISSQIELGVELDFPDPTKIGADRLANASAVAGDYPGESVVVVDFGTAVTFDIVDKRPAYLGGVIAPGLDAMKHYLHQRTALLPEIEIKAPPSPIGKSTEHAMQSGAFYGYRGLVKEILLQIEQETKTTSKVIATGGYASLMAKDFPEIELVSPYLTMEGLLRIARIHFS